LLSDWSHGNAHFLRGVVTYPRVRPHRYTLETLKARVHGVRYPSEAKTALAEAGITYGGWLPNHEAGRRTIQARHTCAHRVEELLGFCRELGVETGSLEPVVQERVTA
jgi:hypothetical protein